MLNEILEFKQYTKKPATGGKCRLKYAKLLKKNFAGIERAMTVIARNYIFDGKLGNEFNEEKEEKVREILKAWCGFNSTVEVNEKGWLKDYIKQVFLEAAVGRCKETIENATIEEGERRKMLGLLNIDELLADIPLFKNDEETEKDDAPGITKTNNNKSKKISIRNVEELKRLLKDYAGLQKNTSNDINMIHFAIQALYSLSAKNRAFSHKLYYPESTKIDNDLKTITYERIIANALELGELKNYCLACDKDLFEEGLVSKKTEKKQNTTPILPEGNRKDNDSHKHARDLILKITASYLLQKKHTDQEHVYFNQVDVENWLVLEKADIGSRARSVFRFGKEKEPTPIFTVTTISNNVTKIKAHPEWIKNFWLVEEKDIKNLIAGRIYYKDQGACEYFVRYVAE